MSVNVGRTKLQTLLKDLQAKWDHAKGEWNDPMSRELEKTHLVPLERKVRAAVAAMEQMGGVLGRARRECGR